MLQPVKEVFSDVDAPDLLVGLGQPDDAAIWRLDEERALVVTTDFFTPVVDDGYDYGAIAAANSLSDIYAMGGKPFMALNVAGIPKDLPNEITREIFRGGAEKALEACVVIAGGHTVQDKEPKYGLMALGFVDPNKAMTKAGFDVGDKLVITKPLGFGVTSTALKRQQADSEDVEEVVGWMKQLNNIAAELAIEFGVLGATDVTGFSLLGHGIESADASGVGLRIEYAKVGMVSGAMKYASEFTFPGGAMDNREFFGDKVSFADGMSEAEQMLLFDPQTSGGLLLSVPGEKLVDFVARADEVEQPVWVIGEVVKGHGIEVVK